MSFEAKTYMQLNSKIQNPTFFFCVLLHCLIACSLNQYPSMWRQCFIVYSIFFIYFTLIQRKKIGGEVKKQVFSLILIVVYGDIKTSVDIQTYGGVQTSWGIQHLGCVQTFGASRVQLYHLV